MGEISKKMWMTCMSHPDHRAVGRSLEVAMKWSPFLPMEVRLDTHSSDGEWLFGRDLLIAGMESQAGDPELNDVWISPWGELEIRVVLVTSEFWAAFVFARSEVQKFIDATVEQIAPADEEPLWIDWDVLARTLLADDGAGA